MATRIVSAKRARSRVVVRARSFLDARAEVLPGERKFFDYAFPPTHVALEVVTNTGGRVGWHSSPLPGPLVPSRSAHLAASPAPGAALLGQHAIGVVSFHLRTSRGRGV